MWPCFKQAQMPQFHAYDELFFSLPDMTLAGRRVADRENGTGRDEGTLWQLIDCKWDRRIIN